MISNRVRSVKMTLPAWQALLRNIGVSNLPADTKVQSAFSDPWTRNVHVVVESASFDEVAEGDAMPELDLALDPSMAMMGSISHDLGAFCRNKPGSMTAVENDIAWIIARFDGDELAKLYATLHDALGYRRAACDARIATLKKRLDGKKGP